MVRSTTGRTGAAVALVCAVAIGCGDDGPARTTTVTGLPTRQLVLASELCEGTARERARAAAQVERLERAQRADPRALVQTSYVPAHEPGTRTEEVTVTELVRGHHQGALEVVETGDRRASACASRLVARLERLMRLAD